MRYNLKITRSERGSVTVFVVIIFLSVLTLMGMSVSMLSSGEQVVLGDKVSTVQNVYSFIGGGDFALAYIEAGKFENGYLPISIGGIDIYADTMATTSTEKELYDDAQKVMILTNPYNPDYCVKVYFNYAEGSYGSSAVLISGTLDDVDMENGGDCITGAAPPAVDVDALIALAQDQETYYEGNYQPPDGHPGNGNFYEDDGTTPHVTYVDGDLNIDRNDDVYGIYVVTGNVNMEKYSNLYGVIYVASDEARNITMSARTDVYGGICGNTSVESTGLNHGDVYYDQERMGVFDQFEAGGEEEGGGGGMVSNKHWVIG